MNYFNIDKTNHYVDIRPNSLKKPLEKKQINIPYVFDLSFLKFLYFLPGQNERLMTLDKAHNCSANITTYPTFILFCQGFYIKIMNRIKMINLISGVNAGCFPACSNMFEHKFTNGTGVRCWVAGWGRDASKDLGQ